MRIIAEVGSNWANIEDCVKSISLAKACGADAVKFQLFSYEDLYGFSAPEAEYAVSSCELRPEWLPRLKEKADAFGIEFMCTAFSPEGYKVVDSFVRTHKIASAEMTHVGILDAVKHMGKPVIMSTGAHFEPDIVRALDRIGGKVPVTLMYCISDYPTNYTFAPDIELLRKKYLLPIGLSDHSTEVYSVPGLAKSYGATVLEKHFNAVSHRGPDERHSLNTDEFIAMTEFLRCGTKRGLKKEEPMHLKHNRRLIATRHIKPDDKLVYGQNFGIYRSTKPDVTALSPWAFMEVNGARARTQMYPGDAITPASVMIKGNGR